MRDIQLAIPGLGGWLQRVFTVLGGFMIGAGALTIWVSTSDFRAQAGTQKGRKTIVIAMVGMSTVGTMSLTNFQLDSDFKWLLLVPSLLWLIALALLHRDDRR